jgi:signal transduction histidine kinase
MRYASPLELPMRARLLAAAQRRTHRPLTVGVPVAIACIAAETLLAYFLTWIAPVHTVNMVYLPGIVVVASLWGLRLGIGTALTSAATFDYFLLPPIWSLRPTKISDLAVPAIFLTVAALTCMLSALARSLAVEADARQEADLTAELARLLLRGPDLRTALPAAARRLQGALGLPSVSIEPGRVNPDEHHRALPLDDGGRPVTLIVPAGLTKPMLRRLRERVLPSLEVLLQAAREREDSAEALKASRARIVAAADASRHRIERDLHDGAQQRLVSALVRLRVLGATPPPPAELGRNLTQITQILDEALTDLQEISRGLHPSILAKGGIQPALTALARRCPIIVHLNISNGPRLAEPLETTVYYVASEALTNAAKHAHASVVDIDLSIGSIVRLAIRDNGVGGADPSRGSGLTGLTDRIEALDGTITIASPAGGGTELLVELPAPRSPMPSS